MCTFPDKNNPNFWPEFVEMSPSTHPTIIKSKASNVITISGIDFPSINSETLKEYFIKVSASSSRDKIIFHCCNFEDFEALKLNVFFEFDGCSFSKDVKIESSIKPIKLERIEFNCSSVEFVGISNTVCQLHLNDCKFNSPVTVRNFNFEIEVPGHGSFPSFFSKLNFEKALTLLDVTFPKEMIFNSVVWPKEINANRDTFRQLKVCMEEQKNALQANIFHSLEMNEYRKELFAEGFFNFANWNDKLVFLFNWAISNFTLSWFRPLVLIFVVSAVFFMWSCGGDAFSQCGMNGYFHFMNPLNRTTEHYYAVYSIWFIHKVVLIVLSYHLIVAVKRKTKY